MYWWTMKEASGRRVSVYLLIKRPIASLISLIMLYFMSLSQVFSFHCCTILLSKASLNYEVKHMDFFHFPFHHSFSSFPNGHQPAAINEQCFCVASLHLSTVFSVQNAVKHQSYEWKQNLLWALSAQRVVASGKFCVFYLDGFKKDFALFSFIQLMLFVIFTKSVYLSEI